MMSENHLAIRIHLRAYVPAQILGFPQHIAHESASFLLFNGVECRDAISAAEQAGKMLAILAETIIVINKEHSLAQAHQVGSHN